MDQLLRNKEDQSLGVKQKKIYLRKKILKSLYFNGPQSNTNLAKSIQLSVPNVTGLISDLIADDLVGISFLHFKDFDKITNRHCVSMSGLAKSVIGAIEIAICDIKSQICKVPLCQYLAGTCENVLKCYYSGGSVVLTPQQIKDDVNGAIDLGHDAYKMRVGLQDNDLERVKAARDALGSKCLMVDAVQSTLHSWDLDIH